MYHIYITLHYITLHYITLHYIHTYIHNHIYIYIYIYTSYIHIMHMHAYGTGHVLWVISRCGWQIAKELRAQHHTCHPEHEVGQQWEFEGLGELLYCLVSIVPWLMAHCCTSQNNQSLPRWCEPASLQTMALCSPKLSLWRSRCLWHWRLTLACQAGCLMNERQFQSQSICIQKKPWYLSKEMKHDHLKT